LLKKLPRDNRLLRVPTPDSGWLVRELQIVETLDLLAIPIAAYLFWVQVAVILRVAKLVKAIK
jgi:hypothetical protein